MKRLVLVLIGLLAFSISACTQMGTGQGGHMMGNGWGWGMGFGFGWVSIIIIAILIIFGIAYMVKRK